MIDGLPWWAIPGVAVLLFAALSLLVLMVVRLVRDALDFLDGEEWK